jgi:hypothetical protein
VKIKGTCKRDGRDFLAEQVIDTGGRCPWDGQPFNANYAATLVNALRDAEEAGTRLERSLETIADLTPEFTLHTQTVLGHLTTQLDRLSKNLIRQG